MNFLKTLGSQNGKAVGWLILFIIIILVITVFKISKLYFDNATLKSQVEQIAERSLLEADYQLDENLINTAKQYNILLTPDDIKTTYNDRRDQMKLSFEYLRAVDFFVFSKSFAFKIELSKELAKEKGIIDKFQRDAEKAVKGASEQFMDKNKDTLSQ
jgi:hypothetical protein